MSTLTVDHLTEEELHRLRLRAQHDFLRIGTVEVRCPVLLRMIAEIEESRKQPNV